MMKIMLKNTKTNEVRCYQPKNPFNIRYGNLITFARELYGNFGFTLTYRHPFDPLKIISTQEDLNQFLKSTQNTQQMLISLEPTSSLYERTGESYSSSGSESVLAINRSSGSESKSRGDLERSPVGRFRKIKTSHLESESSHSNIDELIESRVAQIVENKVDSLLDEKIQRLVSHRVEEKIKSHSSFNDYESNHPSDKGVYSRHQQYHPQALRTHRMGSQNDFASLSHGEREKHYGNSFDANSVYSSYHPETQPQPFLNNPVNGKNKHHPERNAESAKSLGPYVTYQDYFTTAVLTENHSSHSPRIALTSYKAQQYETGGDIYIKLEEKKKKQSRKKSASAKNCQCRSRCTSNHRKNPMNELKKMDFKVKEKDVDKKKKQKLVKQKIVKVSKALEVDEDFVKKVVEENLHLQAIEIIQKIKQKSALIPENYPKKKDQERQRSWKRMRNLDRGSGEKNMFRRVQRLESHSKNEQQKKKVFSHHSANSHSLKNFEELEEPEKKTKTYQEKGKIWLDMCAMFGQDKKSELFKFIQKYEYLSEEKIIQLWTEQKEFQL